MGVALIFGNLYDFLLRNLNEMATIQTQTKTLLGHERLRTLTDAGANSHTNRCSYT